MKQLLAFIDMVMATRPVLLIPVWGFTLLGVRAAEGQSSFLSVFPATNAHQGTTLGYSLLFSLSVAAVYVLNQLTDIEADKKNGGLPLIASGIVTPRQATVIMILAAFASVVVPLITGKPAIALLSAVSLVIGYFYCVKPFRFSGRPVLDFLSNALGYGIVAFGAGWILSGKPLFNVQFIQAALPYFLLMCAGSISSTLPDIEGDREDAKLTTAVVFGTMKAHTIAFACLLAALASGIFIHDTIALLCAAVSLPFYAAFYVKQNSFFKEATYKIGGGFCMIPAGLFMWQFMLAALVTIAGTWVYFRMRHHCSYPSLVPLGSSHE